MNHYGASFLIAAVAGNVTLLALLWTVCVTGRRVPAIGWNFTFHLLLVVWLMTFAFPDIVELP